MGPKKRVDTQKSEGESNGKNNDQREEFDYQKSGSPGKLDQANGRNVQAQE